MKYERLVMFLEGEQWLDFPGYDGVYQVSSKGRVACMYKSSNGTTHLRDEPVLIKTHFNKVTGYWQIAFGKWHTDRARRMTIHRAVALTFIANPDNLPEVNHKDGDKSNNCVENLEWSTRVDNIRHGVKMGLIVALKGEETPNSKLTNSTVLEILNSPVGPRELSRRMNIPYATIAGIRNGASWNHITGLPKRKWGKTA